MNLTKQSEMKKALRSIILSNDLTFDAYSYEVNEYDVNPHISCRAHDEKSSYELICYAQEGCDIEMKHYTKDGELYNETSH